MLLNILAWDKHVFPFLHVHFSLLFYINEISAEYYKINPNQFSKLRYTLSTKSYEDNCLNGFEKWVTHLS